MPVRKIKVSKRSVYIYQFLILHSNVNAKFVKFSQNMLIDLKVLALMLTYFIKIR